MISSDTAQHIAQVYSQSLFDLAKQNQLIDAVKNNLDVLQNLITSQENFLFFLSSPHFSVEEKQNMIQKIGFSFNDLTLNFMMVALSHNRMNLLPSIIAGFEKFYQEYHNYCSVRVTVAQALPDNEIQALKAALANAIGSDTVILEMRVNPSIIGGAVIHFKDKVIDNSITSRLRHAVDEIITHGRYQGKVYEA